MTGEAIRTTSGISAADYYAVKAKRMSEQQLQDAVIAAAYATGYELVYHTHDSRRSQPGWPDLVLIHTHRKVALFRELKTMTGRPTPRQLEWLAGLTAAGLDARVWRPIDWFDGTITAELTGRTPGEDPWL